MKIFNLLLIILLSAQLSARMDPYNPVEFVILVPSYNNEKWAARNLESLVHQKTTLPYSIVCIDDCSKDETGALMDGYAARYSFVKVVHNKKRMGAMANIYNGVHTHCKDHQVVVLVDGDDFLAHNLILERLEKEYADPNLWMTYGQFIFYPSSQWGTTYEIPRSALEKKELRTLVYVAQHLRTFKAGLFKRIKKEDLMFNGEFLTMNADMACMIPMLEMAAPKNEHAPNHSKFIPDIMYIYNYVNPISDFRIDRGLQLDLEKVIRAIKPYEPLEKLD